MSQSRPVHDPLVLRAIAHPLRNRILSELSARGPSRAADIARSLDVPANQASFHLRQLAKYGLVAEDPEAARDRRDRVWKAVDEHGLLISLDAIEASPGGKAAARVFRASAAAWGHQVVDDVYATDHAPGGLHSVSDLAIRLTKSEAQELAAELEAVAQRWAERTRGADDSRSTYVWFSVLTPYPAHAKREQD